MQKFKAKVVDALCIPWLGCKHGFVSHHVIENVVAAFIWCLVGYPWLLQQVHLGEKDDLLLSKLKSFWPPYQPLRPCQTDWNGCEWTFQICEVYRRWIQCQNKKNNIWRLRWKIRDLDELSFLTVLAFPKASRTGFVCTIWSSRDTWWPKIVRTRILGWNKPESGPSPCLSSLLFQQSSRSPDQIFVKSFNNGICLFFCTLLQNIFYLWWHKVDLKVLMFLTSRTFLVFSVLPAPDSPVTRIDWFFPEKNFMKLIFVQIKCSPWLTILW